MANIWGFAVVVFLIAHALVGVLMFAGSPPEPTASWPRSESWLLSRMGASGDAQKMIAIALMAIAGLLLVGGALGVLGVPGIVGLWSTAVVSGAIISGLTLIVYYSHWWLGGIAINLGFVVVILALKWPTNEALGI